MNLPDRIKLINVMIQQNPDARIIDYLKEIESLTTGKMQEMNKPKKYTVDDALFMMRHAGEYNAREMAEKLNIDIDAVYGFGSRNNLTFKTVTAQKKREEPRHLESVRSDAPKVKMIRPPSNYDNLKTNYL